MTEVDMTPDAGLPEGLTDDAILTFVLEKWDTPKAGPSRRKLYKLQRALDVADLWPLKSTAFDVRLQEKEKLLSAVHRAATAREVPEFKKGDPDQGGPSMRALASLRSLSLCELREGLPFTSSKAFKPQRPHANWRPDNRGQGGGKQRGGGAGFWQDGRFNDSATDRGGTDRDRYGSAWEDE